MNITYIYSDNVDKVLFDDANFDDIPQHQLLSMYSKCISSIDPNTISQANLQDTLILLAENLGPCKFLYRCDECWDSVYEFPLVTKNHSVTWTSGCIVYNLTVDEKDYCEIQITYLLGVIVDILKEYADKIPNWLLYDLFVEFLVEFGKSTEQDNSGTYQYSLVV